MNILRPCPYCGELMKNTQGKWEDYKKRKHCASWTCAMKYKKEMGYKFNGRIKGAE